MYLLSIITMHLTACLDKAGTSRIKTYDSEMIPLQLITVNYL